MAKRKRTWTELPVMWQDVDGRLVEAIGLYRGHVWAVTFVPKMGHRCAYISYDRESDKNPEEVLQHEITFWGKGDHIVENGFLGMPLIGWDYMSFHICSDFHSSRKYLFTAPIGDEVKQEVLDSIHRVKEIQRIFKPKIRHSLSSVIKDCKSEIDRLIDGIPEETQEIQKG